MQLDPDSGQPEIYGIERFLENETRSDDTIWRKSSIGFRVIFIPSSSTNLRSCITYLDFFELATFARIIYVISLSFVNLRIIKFVRSRMEDRGASNAAVKIE